MFLHVNYFSFTVEADGSEVTSAFLSSCFLNHDSASWVDGGGTGECWLGVGYGNTDLQVTSPSDSVGKESTCNAGDTSSIPGSGRSPGEGNGNPLQCSWLGTPMDRGAWRGTVHGVTKS